MTRPVSELKTRARLRLNALRRLPHGDEAAIRSARDTKLHDCLHAVARDAGFLHWEHARRVLGGLAQPGDDMGAFWHARGCELLLSHWVADLSKARSDCARMPGSFLVPYRRQYVVARPEFIAELGMDPSDPAWADAGHDLVASYAGAAWQRLAMQRLQAMRAGARSRPVT